MLRSCLVSSLGPLAIVMLRTAASSGQTTIDWVVNGSDQWNKKSSWQGLNVPNAPNEQARHAQVGLNASSISYNVPQLALQTIHSYVAVPAAQPTPRRELLILSGYTLNLANFLSCEGSGTRYYYVTLPNGARLN